MIGDVASFCCCHDAFVIKDEEDRREVLENWEDEDEEIKYQVVARADAWHLCVDYGDEDKMRACPRIKKLML